MKKAIVACILLNMALVATSAFAQVKMSKEQMLFYTSDWKGDRFPDGRPKLPDSLLTRAVDMTIEDVWEFLRSKGHRPEEEGTATIVLDAGQAFGMRLGFTRRALPNDRR